MVLAGVSTWGMGVMATGFFIAFVFLVAGPSSNSIPAIVICAPILEPLAKSAGMDPVHFAMVGIVSLAFGLVNSALRSDSVDRLLGRRHTHEDAIVGHQPHAVTNARCPGAPHHMAGGRPVPTAADLARVLAVSPYAADPEAWAVFA